MPDDKKYPGIVQSIADTKPGQKFVEIITDPALFLRVGVMVIAYLGMIHLLFNLWSNSNSAPAVIWQGIFADLFLTFLGIGVFYYMRTMVESDRKP